MKISDLLKVEGIKLNGSASSKMDAIDQLDDPKPKDVCGLLGIDGRQYDNLRKKLNRRLTKIIQK